MTYEVSYAMCLDAHRIALQNIEIFIVCQRKCSSIMYWIILMTSKHLSTSLLSALLFSWPWTKFISDVTLLSQWSYLACWAKLVPDMLRSSWHQALHWFPVMFLLSYLPGLTTCEKDELRSRICYNSTFVLIEFIHGVVVDVFMNALPELKSKNISWK